MKRIRIQPDFADKIARAGFTLTDFAEQAQVNRTTIHQLLNPDQYPARRGGMQRITAWKLAKAYARATGIAEQQAFSELIVEEPIDQAAA